MKILKILAIAAPMLCGFTPTKASVHTLRSKGEVLLIAHDGYRQQLPWLISPQTAVDTLATTAREVTLISPVDTLTVSTGAEWDATDVAVITENGDTALTRIVRHPADVYSHPDRNTGCLLPGHKLTRKQARFDLDALMNALREIHPDIYSVTGQEKLLTRFHQVRESLPDTMTTVEFYKAAAPIVSMIGDGHTMLRFPYNDLFTSDLQRLPIFVDVKSDRTLKVATCIDSIVPAGSDVLSINGKTAGEMIDAMLPYVSGERDFFRVMRIDNEFPALFEMLYGGQPQYEVKFRRPGKKKTETTVIPAAKFDEIFKRSPKRKNPAPKANYSYSIDQERRVAVMDFRRFHGTPGQMTQFCDSMFADMKARGIDRLIIDVRNNGGGNSAIGDVLLHYISPVPFTQFAKTLVNRSAKVLRMIGDSDFAPTVEFYQKPAEQYTRPLAPGDGHFDGTVILLTSNHTFSSASAFSWAFKHFGCGKVVGEETGGMNVAYGDILTWTAPVSGIPCTISWKRFWHPGADEADIHGTIPDIETSADHALTTALSLLSR